MVQHGGGSAAAMYSDAQAKQSPVLLGAGNVAHGTVGRQRRGDVTARLCFVLSGKVAALQCRAECGSGKAERC
jgi:hypothetical protein